MVLLAYVCMYEDLSSRYEDVAMYPRGVKCCGKHMHEMRLPSIWKTRHKLRYGCFPVQYFARVCACYVAT